MQAIYAQWHLIWQKTIHMSGDYCQYRQQNYYHIGNHGTSPLLPISSREILIYVLGSFSLGFKPLLAYATTLSMPSCS